MLVREARQQTTALEPDSLGQDGSPAVYATATAEDAHVRPLQAAWPSAALPPVLELAW